MTGQSSGSEHPLSNKLPQRPLKELVVEGKMSGRFRKVRAVKALKKEVVRNPMRLPFRNAIKRLSLGQIAFLVFALFIAGISAIAWLLPPPKDAEAEAECKVQCAPFIGQVGRDKDYPMSTRGNYREQCICS